MWCTRSLHWINHDNEWIRRHSRIPVDFRYCSHNITEYIGDKYIPVRFTVHCNTWCLVSWSVVPLSNKMNMNIGNYRWSGSASKLNLPLTRSAFINCGTFTSAPQVDIYFRFVIENTISLLNLYEYFYCTWIRNLTVLRPMLESFSTILAEITFCFNMMHGQG